MNPSLWHVSLLRSRSTSRNASTSPEHSLGSTGLNTRNIIQFWTLYEWLLFISPTVAVIYSCLFSPITCRSLNKFSATDSFSGFQHFRINIHRSEFRIPWDGGICRYFYSILFYRYILLSLFNFLNKKP
jgi:hypothetical protein